MTREELISRICKLLALAASTRFPDEAGSAHRKASALMAEHGLTAEEIERRTSDAETRLGCTRITLRTKQFPRWVWPLSNAIGEVTGTFDLGADCRPRVAEVHFYGEARHRALAAHFLVVCLREVDRLTAEAKAKRRMSRKDITDFRVGLAHSLGDQLRKLLKPAAGCGSALIPSSAALVRSAELCARRDSPCGWNSTIHEQPASKAYRSGYAAGKSSNLRPPLG